MSNAPRSLSPSPLKNSASQLRSRHGSQLVIKNTSADSVQPQDRKASRVLIPPITSQTTAKNNVQIYSSHLFYPPANLINPDPPRYHRTFSLLLSRFLKQHGFKKKMFDKYMNQFTGRDLCTYLVTHAQCFDAEEASRWGGYMIDYGYLCPLTPGVFSPEASYILQNTFYWVSAWTPHLMDYTVHLYKSYTYKDDKYVLRPYELQRLLSLKQEYEKMWTDIEDRAKMIHMYENSLDKVEKRTLILQRYKKETVLFFESIAKQKSKSTRSIPTDAQPDPEKLLVHLQNNAINLQTSLSLNRVKSSTACQAIVKRCTLYTHRDPMMNKEIKNYFFESSEVQVPDHEGHIDFFTSDASMSRVHVTMADLDLWAHSFKDLLDDPCGIAFFEHFVTAEHAQENIQFWRACQVLSTFGTAKQFSAVSKFIYKQFIVEGAKQEINIPYNVKKDSVTTLEAVLRDETLPLSLYWYYDALHHILELMARDSYHRFLTCDTSRYVIMKKKLAEETLIIEKEVECAKHV